MKTAAVSVQNIETCSELSRTESNWRGSKEKAQESRRFQLTRLQLQNAVSRREGRNTPEIECPWRGTQHHPLQITLLCPALLTKLELMRVTAQRLLKSSPGRVFGYLVLGQKFLLKKIGKILLVLSSQGMTVECFHCYPSPSGRMRSDPPFRRTSPGLIASIGLPD
ncbi:hypothetical protein AV530_007428 [Patagioenas fasciata monilis]|uniref:Uncharacterized protein n=1 Tax=Patagioenas fasciata monilis TaxID=372326 RepID=A0A1V4JXX8_PATFA|nr:hypothetical protein AV530_007428 [Patagioenas fasciata monilis]